MEAYQFGEKDEPGLQCTLHLYVITPLSGVINRPSMVVCRIMDKCPNAFLEGCFLRCKKKILL